MRSRIRTCSSHQAPYLPKAQRGCRLSMMTWKLLSVFVPVPVQRTELFNFFVHLFIGFQHLSQTSTLIEDVTPDLRMRDRELTEIAKSIADLAELFKDLSVLVIDQGTLLDSVEYNIEQTSVQVAEAVKELDMATRYVVSAALLRGSPVMMRFC
jgi:hypothetical protein